MRICGVDIKSDEARITLVEFGEGEVQIVQSQVKKIKLGDDTNRDNLRSFLQTFQGVVSDNGIDRIVIKSRQKKGKMAGGAVSFKIETLIQLLDGCEVDFISPISISSYIKKNPMTKPIELLEYQKDAYFAAVINFLRNGV
ncbi:MAG: DUF3010 family protein [Rhodospirillales bacterium]|nr:DUF3010 family protein [Rhodospirillales bacterium]